MIDALLVIWQLADCSQTYGYQDDLSFVNCCDQSMPKKYCSVRVSCCSALRFIELKFYHACNSAQLSLSQSMHV